MESISGAVYPSEWDAVAAGDDDDDDDVSNGCCRYLIRKCAKLYLCVLMRMCVFSLSFSYVFALFKNFTGDKLYIDSLDRTYRLQWVFVAN